VLIDRTEPNYPSELRNAGIGGSVTLMAVISTDGRVKSVRTLRGDPQLVPLAKDAVLQWFYKPTMLDGRPVETETSIIVSFTPTTASASARVFDERIQKLRHLSELQQPELISRKEPVRQPISGTVIFRATVGIDGKLSNIRVTDAPPELVPAALDAVKQWVYRPAKLNGKPVEADTVITMRFPSDR
jgi:TonB family protein